MIYLMIEIFTIFVSAEVTIGWHWHLVAFGFVHAKFLEVVLKVLLLRYKDTIGWLSNLKP